MELRKGFIHTDIGILPEYWEIEPVKTVADVRTGPFGSALHESDYVSDGTPIITVEHLGERGIEHINLPLVSDSDKRRLSSYMLVENDIVFSRVGSVDRNSLVRKSEIGWLFSGRLLRLRIRNKRISPSFLSHYFHSEDFKNRIRNVAVGQTMASLNTQILNDIQIAFPPYPEQKAIAEVLSDVDALIASLNTLIAKKRVIKKGVMQELLTGKTRLPGFRGEWNKRRLGDCGKITMGQSPPGDSYNIEMQGLPLLNGAADLKEEGIFVSQYTTKPTRSSKRNDLLFCIRATIGNLQVSDKEYCLGRGIAALTVDRDHCQGFIAYQLQGLFSSMRQKSEGGVIKGLRKDELKEMTIDIPNLIEEQNAIASFLEDLDNEINNLENRIDKTRNLKLGMMQELLTGRIRLRGGTQ